MIFIDSNIIIDLASRDPIWFERSRAAVGDLGAEDEMVVNVVVLAETASRFASSSDQMSFLHRLTIGVRDMSAQAGYQAGLAYRQYRQAGGPRQAILADFLIGGHAAAENMRLLTRDRRRFARYFPELTLITPGTDHD